MYVEQPYHRSIPVQSPFEKGFSFLKTRLHICVLIALAAGAVRVAGFYFRHFFPLPGEEKLLIDFLTFGSYGWLIMASFLVASEGVLGRLPAFVWIAGRAIISMPKVVLSLLCFLVALGFAMEAPPVVVFVLFLIWAPFFAAGEFYSPPIPKIEPEEDEQLDQDFYVARPRFKVGLFRFRSVWDLGFSRSVNFTSRNFLFTVQYALVLWVTIVGPRGLVVMFTGYYPGFGDSVVQIFLSSFVEVIAAVVGAFGMLSVLPAEALGELRGDELKLGGGRAARADSTPEAVPEEPEPVPGPARPRGYLRENLLFLSLALFGAGATYCLWGMWQHQLRFPPGMKIEVERAEVSEGRFIIALKLEDDRFNFRTLRPDMFRLELRPEGGPPVAAVKAPEPAAPSSDGSKEGEGSEKGAPAAANAGSANQTAADGNGKSDGAPPAEPELPAPSRAIPYTLEGEPLPEDNFAPYAKPIRLNLYFKIDDVAGAGGEYTLYYLNFLSLHGQKDKVVSGSYGAAPSAARGSLSSRGSERRKTDRSGSAVPSSAGVSSPSSAELPSAFHLVSRMSVGLVLDGEDWTR